MPPLEISDTYHSPDAGCCSLNADRLLGQDVDLLGRAQPQALIIRYVYMCCKAQPFSSKSHRDPPALNFKLRTIFVCNLSACSPNPNPLLNSPWNPANLPKILQKLFEVSSLHNLSPPPSWILRQTLRLKASN